MKENSLSQKLSLALLSLRWTVFLVMFMWTLDKFVNTEHASKVFANFYYLSGLESMVIQAFGAIEMVIIIMFLLGIKKRFSYGMVFLFHFISTISSYKQYLNPYEGGLLFFAAWPMLAACYALYILRDYDNKCTLGTTS